MIGGQHARLRVWTYCLAGALAWCAWATVRAADKPLPAAEARQWLVRMHTAATQRNYQGTLVVTADGVMSSSRLAHFCEGNESYERADMLDGQMRRVLRHNDKVVTVWPSSKVARVERREPIQAFPRLPSGGEEQLFDRYDMVSEGPGRVAGHEAAVFLLRPRDNSRFAQRLWAEQGSGLLLRADVLAQDGRVLETTAFSDVAIGVRAQPDSVLAAMKKLDGYRVVKALPRRTSLDDEGWQLKNPIAGFRQVSCVKRSLDPLADADRPAGAEVLQAIFSDGLTHVSLFIEPHQADRHRAGSATIGATHTWMQPVGAHWLTVVGDVPMATLKQFAAALEPKR